jgi:hypothetical protein
MLGTGSTADFPWRATLPDGIFSAVSPGATLPGGILLADSPVATLSDDKFFAAAQIPILQGWISLADSPIFTLPLGSLNTARAICVAASTSPPDGNAGNSHDQVSTRAHFVRKRSDATSSSISFRTR